MLKNYFKIAYRNLKRHKGYTAINVLGLAAGMAACLLIGLFVQDELNYDRFHEKADRIYRVVEHVEAQGQTHDDLIHAAPLGPALLRDVQEIERVVRLNQSRASESLLRYGEQSDYEGDIFFVDSSFFDVFTFPLLHGDAATALTRPFTIVLSETTARKYFGSENPVGKQVTLDGIYGEAYDFEVTGVARDVPPNAHFRFNALLSFSTLPGVMPRPEHLESWRRTAYYVYVLLEEGASPEMLEAKLSDILSTYREVRPGVSSSYVLQPLTDVHLYSHFEREIEPNSDPRYLYVFSAVALLILLIACINYMTLATARAAQRAREVGVRKVVGATRGQLARQFLGESALLTVMALALAAGIVQLSLPVFNQFTGKDVGVGFASAPWFWPALLGGGVLISLLAGGYPALFLSGFRPTRAIRGLTGRGASNAWFRSGLVTLQFAISIALIASTLVVQRQLDYMQNKRLGLNPEQVIVLDTRGKLGTVSQRFGPFKQELLRNPAITHVTAINPGLPMPADHSHGLRPEDPREAPSREEAEASPTATVLSAGMDFLETLDIPLVRGRTFRPADFDSIRAEGGFTPVLINQAAANEFGWDEPLGKEFACCLRPTPRVVGVVEDFHYRSLKQRIAPVAITPTWWSRHVLVRVQMDDLPATLDYIEARWSDAAPDYPFDYTFLDSRFAAIYDAEERLAQVFGVFALLAIGIACMGLFGLAAYVAGTRTREIGIRKVLGASVASIVALLSKDFFRLVLVAFALAAPVAYVAMQYWLEDFAYRIAISPWTLLAAGSVALIVAGLSVSYQSVQAALANPTDAIRHE